MPPCAEPPLRGVVTSGRPGRDSRLPAGGFRTARLRILRAAPWLLPPLVAACAAHRTIPDRLRELPPDFKRLPYVQNVTPTGAVVAWQTHSPESSTLQFWTGDSTSKLTISDTTVAIDHAIALDPLQPETEYRYQVQTWEGKFIEPPGTFRTPPQAGTRKPFKFLVFGDSGEGTDEQLAVADKMVGEENVALAIHAGDVAYDNGSEIDFDFRHFAVYKDLMDGVPFYPSLGNHDVRTEDGAPYLNAFHLPANNGAKTERYYSFQQDNVLFVSLDSNTNPTYAARFGDLRNSGSAQHRWLHDELERARADTTVDWIVVFFHHAIFSAGRGIAGHGSDIGLQQSLVPLFDQYAVDVVFTGHDHHYERTYPIRCGAAPVLPPCLATGEDPKKVKQGSGTVYFVTGGGGGPFAWRSVGKSWWTAFAVQVLQYVRVEVTADALVVQSVNTAGAVIDDVRIEKAGGQPPQEEKPEEEKPPDENPLQEKQEPPPEEKPAQEGARQEAPAREGGR